MPEDVVLGEREKRTDREVSPATWKGIGSDRFSEPRERELVSSELFYFELG